MNDFSDIESKLRKLRPVQPSADLRTRIERALAEETSTRLRSATARQASTAGVLPREPRFHFNWLSLGLGLAAAAALVLFAFVRLERSAKKTPSLAAITPAPTFSSANAKTFLARGDYTSAGVFDKLKCAIYSGRFDAGCLSHSRRRTSF